MWRKYFIFNLLDVNTISISSLELKNLVEFTDKNLQKEFDNKKQIYKDFFTSYIKKFKKEPESFSERLEQIIFVREFVNVNKISMYGMVGFLDNLKSQEKKVEYDNYSYNLYFKLYDIKKFNEIHIETKSNELALDDLNKQENNKKFQGEIYKNLSKNEDLYRQEREKTEKIIETINIKDLQINEKEFNYEIPSLKNDDILSLIINEFINCGAFKDKDKKYIYNYVIGYFEIIIYIYEKYYEDLYNKSEDLHKEFKIIKEIIYFTNKKKQSDKNLGNLIWHEIYFLLKYLDNKDIYLIYKNASYMYIKKIDKDYYLYYFIDNKSYILQKIKDFNKLKKLQIIFEIFRSIHIGENDEVFLHRENLSFIYDKYSEILNSLLHEEKIYYF